jgi:hypothetical protein
MNGYKPTEESAKVSRLEMLAALLIKDALGGNPNYQLLSKTLLFLHHDDMARIAYEQDLHEYIFGVAVIHKAACNMCLCERIYGWRFVCKSCYDVDLCQECMEKYSEMSPDGCLDHEFLRVPRQLFRIYQLREGKTQATQRWLQSLLADFKVDSDILSTGIGENLWEYGFQEDWSIRVSETSAIN